MATIQQDRQRLIRLIHVGKRELGLDDDTYRAMLSNVVTGKSSSSAMTVPQLERVVAAMKDKGFKVKGGAGTRPQAADKQSSKIRALWLELHRLGYVGNPEEAALAAWVQRMTKVAALQWLSGKQASMVIEELKKWLGRDRAKVRLLVKDLVNAGRLDGSAFDIDKLCLQVTGQVELNRQAAALLVAHLEGLGHDIVP